MNLRSKDSEEGKALEAFRKILATPSAKHAELLDLSRGGWVEGPPAEDCWTFTHPDFPGTRLLWFHDGPVRANREG